ncbi:uncharacterized protein LOC126969204 isoform X2 [Leptidea sinapis]|uniref:uncharacterized protein LOC126969204 isoform X2 n=1 Tax=Leptidea sinapis TaxID=189913 RepID=UPI0021C38A15|nr:uncharacterized protein LOC126969204 isoform X2 [Leptidea sinapis]
MCIRFIIILTLLVPVHPLSDSCKQLKSKYPGDERYVRVDGERVPLVVNGGGGTARAAAALLHVAVKYGLHYSASLDETHADPCNLHDNSDEVSNQFYYSTNCAEKFCGIMLVRNESRYDTQVITEILKKAKNSGLQFQIIIFENDKDFRSNVYKLRKSNATFAFIDENLWEGEDDVTDVAILCADDICSNSIVFDPVNAIRIGDGYIMKTYAPNIFNTVNNFSASIKDLHDVLHFAYSYNTNIETAACDWALHNERKFTNLFNMTSVYQYDHCIMTYLCKGDKLNNDYLNMIRLAGYAMLHEQLPYSLNFKYTNCTDSDKLKWEISSLQKNPRIAGAIAWSWNAGIKEASSMATLNQIPLMISGPSNDEVLGPAVYASSGRLSSWILAHSYFLSQCSWKRVIILSDKTPYSKLFIEAISKHINTRINHKNEIVTPDTIQNAFYNIKYCDARIILINAECEIAHKIIYSAEDYGLTPKQGYVWISRDWCVSNITESIKNMWHYTIGFSWRGGYVPMSSSKNFTKGIAKLHGNSTVSAGITYLVDALLQLGHGFAMYRREFPENQYDLHGYETASNFSRSLSSIKIQGVAQIMNIKNYSLENPRVFIDKWQGNKHKTTAVWEIRDSTVVELWSHSNYKDKCGVILDAECVPDGKRCLTFTTGDPFTPRCNDIAVTLFTLSMLLVALALMWTRRILKRWQHNRRLELVVTIFENNQRRTSPLIDFMVDRKSIRILHEIGTGCSGRVYFAELTQGSSTYVVAAKEPRDKTSDVNDFLREAYVLARLEHCNVIKLMGVCLTNGPPIVLMEHALNLDLQRYLIERRQAVISTRQGKIVIDDIEELSDKSLTRWAAEAASAVEYLANLKFVHRDIRAANCLIDRMHSLKLADFGMAREVDEEESIYSTKRRSLVPVFWVAPEGLDKGVFTSASDVWSLGVLLLEITTLGLRPYGNWSTDKVIHHVLNGGKPPLPPDISIQTQNVLQQCWYKNPDQRITASKICEYFKNHPQAISPALLAPVPSFLDPPVHPSS